MRPLISTAELAEALAGGRPPTVLDVRWKLGGPPAIEAYQRGHVPGAVFIDLETDLADPPGGADGGRHPLPDPDRFAEVMRRAGVSDDRQVVVYDFGPGAIAARLWWLLRWTGHRSVAVLDGGYPAWEGEGREISTTVSEPAAGDFTARPGAMPVIDASAAQESARSAVLLDARAPERYAGVVEPMDPRAGHIPGARNVPFTDFVDDKGRWLGESELRDRLARVGVLPGRPVAAYCGSGVTATSVLLALELAGLSDRECPAALYAGSWSEYSADPSRPVATGDQPG